MKYLFLICFSLQTYGAVPGLMISQYPNTNNLADTNRFIIADDVRKTNYNITYGQLRRQLAIDIATNSPVTNLLGNKIDSTNGSAYSLTLRNPLAGASNNIAFIAPGTTASRTLANRANDWLNVIDDGAIGDGVTDESASIRKTYLRAVARGGGKIWFPYGQAGVYLFNNLIITNDNITLVQDSFIQNSIVGHTNTIRLQPYNPALEFIRVGDDSKLVIGFGMQNVSLYGGSVAPFGNVGLNLTGGTYDAHLENVAFMYFKTNVCISGGTNFQTAVIHFDHFSMINSTNSNARGIQVLWPSTGYTTAIYFSDGKIAGPTGAGSYAIEQDGTVVSWTGSYMDSSHAKGVFMNRTGLSSVYPVMIGSGMNIDSGNLTNTVMTLGSGLGAFSVIGNWAQWIEGTVKPTGRLLTSNGSLIEGYPDGAVPHDADILRAEVGIELAFDDYSARSSATNYGYNNVLRIRPRTNDLVIDVNNLTGKLEVNAPDFTISGTEDVHGLFQVDGHAIIATSSTNKNTGQAINLSHDGTNAIIQSASFTNVLSGIQLKANSILGLQMATNAGVTIPVSLNSKGLTEVNGAALLVTSSTTPDTGEAINLRHNGTVGIIQTASFGSNKTPLELWAGGVDSLHIETNGTISVFTNFNVSGNMIVTNGITNLVLSASLPVQTDANKKLISAAINLSGSQVTGVLNPSNLPTGLGITNNGSVLSNNIIAGTNITVQAGANGQLIISAGLGGGTGAVSSVAMTVPPFLSIAGSPITSAGTLAVGLSGTALPVVNGGTESTSLGASITNTGGVLQLSDVGTPSTYTKVVTDSKGRVTVGSTAVLASSDYLGQGGSGEVGFLHHAAGPSFSPGWSAVNLASSDVTGLLPMANMGLVTGTGVTNNSGVLSNNIVAGTGLSITAGTSGQLTITATGTGNTSAISVKTANYTITDNDYTIVMRLNDVQIVTLPAAAGRQGRKFVIKNSQVSTVNVAVTGSDTIDTTIPDGTHPYYNLAEDKAITVQSDGTSVWYIIGGY